MSVPSGPQPGAGQPAAPAADPRSPEPPSALGDADAYESRHVHTVYEAIAPHFSSTRYKPWPLVASFLLSLPPGSVGLDAGCGNGKYIGVNPALYIIASDRSANLNQVVVADSLALPYRGSAFDFAISIAVIHHMSTRERRRAAVAALLGALRPGTGKALVMVWALEQGGSRRGWDAGAAQDQLVSWVTKGKREQDRPARDETFQRYYHLYREGELEEDVAAAGGRVLDRGYERDNWWAVFCRDS
ncbi:hypothetical protein ColTof3_04706 [Colletotrichum tofieldiae]|nr:hypothetical protein ColTof3_04706 [Colletotrichum tofieldiae]